MPRKHIWSVVERLAIEHYNEIKYERLRDGYYIIRDYLADELKQKRITKAEYKKFEAMPGYNYYKSDLLVRIEREKHLPRPKGKPLGTLYNQGDKLSLEQFNEVWQRARGFIFVEKEGAANKLQPLSNYGWAIMAGQGFASRLMRELLKEDKRPLLVLHDADWSGDWINRVFSEGSNRTRHLDLTLDKVVDIGLTIDDAIDMDLPAQPETAAHQNEREWRYELSSLMVLKKRYGISNPILTYTIARMNKLEIPVTPEPAELKDLLWGKAYFEAQMALGVVSDAVQKLLDTITEFSIKVAGEINYPDEGTAVSVDVDTIMDDWENTFEPENDESMQAVSKTIDDLLESIKDDLVDIVQQAIDGHAETSVEEYNQEKFELHDCEKIIDILGGKE